MAPARTPSLTLLDHTITPQMGREIIQKAANAGWGAHLLRWRYFDVQRENVLYHRNALVPSGLWHLLKRIYVDQDWPAGTSQEDLAADIAATIQNASTEIYVYGYYRTDPPRLQWGFLNPQTGIAVVFYDMEADLIATIFKPEEGALFFERQIDAVKINRTEWNV
ncbi:hypothetical protein [Candidatus Amarolinea aalborgensis]|uniref:hypothetical protein n=1 Tax=Candidatus Amarolinea aalborgensis TaxID=2249329 RepID=UPI003BF9BD1D